MATPSTTSLSDSWRSWDPERKFRLLQRLRAEVGSPYLRPGDLAKRLAPSTVSTPMLELLDDRLVDLATGRNDRLIFSCAPQEGKSQRVSRTLPLWLLMRNPDARIGIASYELGVARRWGRYIRNDITSNPQFGLKVRRDTSAAQEWQLEDHIGGVVTVGIEGALTGRPIGGQTVYGPQGPTVGGALIIDDPLKGRAEADSKTYREKCIDFWQETASTRLAPGTPVILVMTRWHEADLAGWLAQNDPRWTVVNVPTVADHDPSKGQVDALGREPGEYLISARGRSAAEWEQIRKQVGSRGWNALYQGRPAPADGGIFKRDWFRTYEHDRYVEHGGRCELLGIDSACWSWDCTFKDTDGSDYVVGQVWGRKGTDAFLIHQVRGRWDFTETARQIELGAVRFPGVPVLIEDKANGPAVISHLRQRVPGIIPVTPEDSKQARASAVAPFAEAGNVHLPAPHLAPWIGDWIEEVCTFPNGAHDDQVDAATQGLHRLFLGYHAGAAYLDELVAMRR
jgi:predicted phage terminase large subunit-like protein